MNQSVGYTASALVVASSIVKVLNHYNVVIPLSAQEIVDLVANGVILVLAAVAMWGRWRVGDINLLGRRK